MTTDCIKQNPANYTVWEYRRQIIKALNIELDSEFAWTSSIIARNIKNFQVWHHRQVGIRFSCHNDQSESEALVTIRKRIFRWFAKWQIMAIMKFHWLIQFWWKTRKIIMRGNIGFGFEIGHFLPSAARRPWVTWPSFYWILSL